MKEKQLTCCKCEFKTSEQSDLVEHMKSHEEKTLNCGECDFKTVNQIELEGHIKSHEGISLACGKCVFKTSNQSELTGHMKSNEGTPLACGNCVFKTGIQSELTEHLKSHHDGSTESINNLEIKKENETLKMEKRALTDSYERLSSMYKKVRDEMNDKIKDCKKELEDAQENFRVAEAENEKLRVTNEIQNNLWKIWMEEHKEKKRKQKLIHQQEMTHMKKKENNQMRMKIPAK